MNIISTIVPIFIIIFLGLFAKQRGFFTPDFISQANRLVYYIAIPAMIFGAISKAALNTQMNLSVIMITLAAVLIITAVAWGTTRVLTLPRSSKGSFIQCSFHGNLGYIGLAVAFYYLGDSGFVKAAIIAGFVMILQNILAVIALQYHNGNETNRPGLLDTLKKTMVNPVILSALAGIVFSFFNVSMPVIIDRALDILKGMALPMALLIIGASLSFEKFKPRFLNVLIATFLKLILAPAIGIVLFKWFSILPEDYLPGLIILASPTATLTYIMAKEIGGDPDFAVAAISICTIFSSVTYGVWLSLG
ncbi:MAG: AEC family transporter [Proteobacteria bacterium]|nr:AEC family transporter [Pseudomonadota bacterium]MBU1584884.1 AEC family transporter [Pseudomonadota bacterium]MBU2456157.1 AEC family transporter [Pseudomonadota bacterium]MBU2627207.1 AEC family transporter [Pseudomonadota bacterium]